MVFIYLDRYFVKSWVVNLGQDQKWPYLIARRRLDGTGLKVLVWRYLAGVYFVLDNIIILLACWWLRVGRRRRLGEMVAIGMFHKPLVGLIWPCMMTFPFFIIMTWYFLKSTTQSLLQSWTMGMRVPIWKLSSTWNFFASRFSSDTSGIIALVLEV